MKQSEMHEILSVLSEDRGWQSVSPQRSEMWCACFPGIEKSLFLKALYKALKSSTREGIPSIGQVTQALNELTAPKDHKLTDSEIWGLLISSVQRFGWMQEDAAMKHMHSLSPTVAHVAAMFGWQNICRWDCIQESTNRAQFTKACKAAAGREIAQLGEKLPSQINRNPHPQPIGELLVNAIAAFESAPEGTQIQTLIGRHDEIDLEDEAESQEREKLDGDDSMPF